MASHVHFGDVEDRAMITVTKNSDVSFSASLGFLQDLHIYHVHMEVPISVASVPSVDARVVGDIDISTISLFEKPESSMVSFEVKLRGVHGQLSSHVELLNTSVPIELDIKANVLKSQSGTPSLKQGITILSRLAEEEDDASSIDTAEPSLH